MDLRNTKIDLRRPDGSIDKEKSAAFLQLATGGDDEKLSGYLQCSDIRECYKNHAAFIIVNDDGMLSLLSREESVYFSLLEAHEYREVVCEPEYFVTFKKPDEELARDSKIAELSAQLKSLQDELAALKSEIE